MTSAAPRLSRPPLVPGLPIIGSAVAVAKNPLEFLRAAHARMGDVFRFVAVVVGVAMVSDRHLAA